jgi:hypothetical protein
MIVQMLRMPRWAALVSLLAAAAGLAPFAAVQLAFNIGVTGSPLSTPHQLYTRQHYPHAAYGPESAGDRLPVELSPRQRKYYEEFVLSIRQAQEGRSMAAVWLNDRAPVTIRQSGPPWLVLLWPAAILCLRDPRRWVLAASLPLFVAVYWLLLVYINEYAIGAVSGVTLLALAGLEAVSALAGRRGQTVRVALLLGLCVTMSWRAWGTSRYATPHEQPVMSAVHRATQQIQGEAILLIHQADDDDPHVEPVYNTDAPYPDQARVIRAHDLGPRNAELFDYYAGIAPHRRVWRYDRSTGRLSDMGVVADLAAATTQPSRRP